MQISLQFDMMVSDTDALLQKSAFRVPDHCPAPRVLVARSHHHVCVPGPHLLLGPEDETLPHILQKANDNIPSCHR